MYCRSPIPLGGRVRLNLSPVARLVGHGLVSDVLGRGVPRLLVNGFSHWSGDELVRRFCTFTYGWVRWDTVMYGGSVVCVCSRATWVAPSQGNLSEGTSSHRGLNMGEPIGQRSMRLNQDNRCRRVSPRDVCVRVSQSNLTLSPHTCRKRAMGEPIDLCSIRYLRVIGRCQPGQP